MLNDEAFEHAWLRREIIKQEGDRSVAIVQAEDGTRYLLKSARPKCRKRLLDLISPPLLKVHRDLTVLDQHGIPLARALGFVKWRRPGQPEQWCQIQEFVDQAITLERALTLQYRGQPEKQMMVIGETALQLARLHQLGRYHGDMKLTNIMVKGERIFLIDIEGGRSLRLRRWQQKDLARFLVGLREAGMHERQLEETVAIYQKHSGNNDARFMGGVDAFTAKISQRRIRRYGSTVKAADKKI